LEVGKILIAADRLARLLVPADERRVGNRLGQLGHADLDGHRQLSPGRSEALADRRHGEPLGVAAGLLGRRGTQRGLDARLLLGLVQSHDSGRARGGRRAAGVQYAPILAEALEAMADLVPRALIMRLLLTPDDLARVRIAEQRRLILLARKRVELLDA